MTKQFNVIKLNIRNVGFMSPSMNLQHFEQWIESLEWHQICIYAHYNL